MRLIGPTLLEHWEGRIINLHPSLLPSFPGQHSIRDALKHRVKLTGCTVHFVDEGVDTGPIIAQESVPVFSNDTQETLAKRIHQAEHSLLPKTVRRWSEGGFYLKDKIVHFVDEVGETTMKVAVLGSGGREHALVWKLSQSERIKELFCVPGNPGIAQLAKCVLSHSMITRTSFIGQIKKKSL